MNSGNRNTWEIRVDLPTSDAEVDPVFYSDFINVFIEEDVNQMVARMTGYDEYNRTCGLYLCVGDVYTYVYFRVE